jgi:hypothetical protein
MMDAHPWRFAGANRLPDRPAIDPIIDEPLVQSDEHMFDGTAWRELNNKERDQKNGEEPRRN